LLAAREPLTPAVCVNIGAPVTSPAAQMRRLLVRSIRSTITNPSGPVRTPACSRASPAVPDLRPRAASITSKPISSPLSSTTTREPSPSPESDERIFATVRFVRMLTPSAVIARSMISEASGSSRGRMRGPRCTTVTVAPRRPIACPSSQPTAPPPRTTSRGGSSVSSQKSSVVRIRVASAPSMMGVTGVAPVAISACVNAMRVPSTFSVRGEVNRARPEMTVTPAASRASRESVGAIEATARRTDANARAKASWPRLPSAAAAISAFDGTHPVQRQSPPRRPLSIRSTRAPKPAAVLLATRPALPPPITTRSHDRGALGVITTSATFRQADRSRPRAAESSVSPPCRPVCGRPGTPGRQARPGRRTGRARR